MVYLVIPDNDSTFRFLSALFFSTVFQTLTRQADIDFKGQLPLHVRVLLRLSSQISEKFPILLNKPQQSVLEI